MHQSVLLINAADVFSLEKLAAAAKDSVVSVITLPEFAHRYADVAQLKLVDNLYDFGQVGRAAAEIYRSHGLDHVIGASERSIPAAGLVRSWFGLPGYGFDTALACSNKHLMKQRLRSAGLPVTDWLTVPTLEGVPRAVQQLGDARVVVKPVFGAGGEHTFVLGSVAEAERLAGSERLAGLRHSDFPVIVERFVDMTAEYHCDGVICDGEVRFAAVSRYHKPLLQQIGDISGSYSLRVGSAEVNEIQELYRRTIEALGLTSGVTHMELFQTVHGFLVGEITCRPGGAGTAELVRLQHGIDLWQAFTELSVGFVPQLAPQEEQRTFAWVDLPMESGRVMALSSPADLAAVPEVVGVEMHAAIGDVIGSHMHTGTTTARVYFGLKDVADLPRRLDELASAYTLEVEPVNIEA
jgi:biotin carboxylase